MVYVSNTPEGRGPVVTGKPVSGVGHNGPAHQTAGAGVTPMAATGAQIPGSDLFLQQAGTLWQDMQPKLRSMFTMPEFETWIRHIQVIAACERMVVLRGANSYAASRIRTQFLNRLQDRWANCDPMGRTLVVDLTRAPLDTRRASDSAADRTVTAGGRTDATDGTAQAVTPLHPHTGFSASAAGLADLEAPAQQGSAPQRLDTFETSQSNELGYALARRVCHDPSGGDVTYLHGQHGTGKTHLVEAIRNALGESRRDLRVLLVPGQNFLAAFQSLLREGKGAQFTAAVCSADVLLVDDIHLICGKRATEDELEQCIRRLNRMGRKVVLTGDVPCEALQVVSAGLMSILKASYRAHLDLPDLELRRKIAAREVTDLAAASPGFHLDDRCLDMIAGRVSGSGREVKGAVRQVYLRSFLLGKEADMNAVLHTISEKSAIPARSLSVERIKRGICAHFDLSLDDLVSPTRRRSIARPRQIAMYLCRKHTERSLPDIGRRFGNRDHATVIHAVKTIEDLILRDPSIAADVDAVVAKLASGQIGG
jgi:chromosomal replication initiator protein